jgi:hypothetical protein
MTWPVKVVATQKVGDQEPRNVPIEGVDVGCKDGYWTMIVRFKEGVTIKAGTDLQITHHLAKP